MSLAHLLKESVTIEPETGRDAYDAVTYGAGVVVNARVEGVSETWRNPDDSVQLVTREIFVGPETVVDEKSRITLDDGSQPPIVAVGPMPGGDGKVFYKAIKTGVKRA